MMLVWKANGKRSSNEYKNEGFFLFIIFLFVLNCSFLEKFQGVRPKKGTFHIDLRHILIEVVPWFEEPGKHGGFVWLFGIF